MKTKDILIHQDYAVRRADSTWRAEVTAVRVEREVWSVNSFRPHTKHDGVSVVFREGPFEGRTRVITPGHVLEPWADYAPKREAETEAKARRQQREELWDDRLVPLAENVRSFDVDAKGITLHLTDEQAELIVNSAALASGCACGAMTPMMTKRRADLLRVLPSCGSQNWLAARNVAKTVGIVPPRANTALHAMKGFEQPWTCRRMVRRGSRLESEWQRTLAGTAALETYERERNEQTMTVLQALSHPMPVQVVAQSAALYKERTRTILGNLEKDGWVTSYRGKRGVKYWKRMTAGRVAVVAYHSELAQAK